jgi:hypothetical protein
VLIPGRFPSATNEPPHGRQHIRVPESMAGCLVLLAYLIQGIGREKRPPTPLRIVGDRP